MRLRAHISHFAGVAIYLLAISGIGMLDAKLSSRVAGQAVILALPYFPNNGTRRPSLVEQRRADAAQAAPLAPEAERIGVTATNAPIISLQILAAQLDLAEHAVSLSVTAP